MLIHIWISPCYWKVTCKHKRSLESDLLTEVDNLQGVPPTGDEGETMVTP